IDGALAISPAPTGTKDKEVLDQLKLKRTAFADAANKPLGDQVERLETAEADLRALKATNTDLQNFLAAVQKTLKAVVQSARAAVASAVKALDKHKSLRLSSGDKDALQSAGRAVQSLKTKLPAATLRQQIAALSQALADLNGIGASGLVSQLLDELTAALEAAPKTVVQEDFRLLL